MSASNRRRGHQFERDVASHLSEALGINVRTGRDGRGGAQTPGDLQWQDDDGRWWPGVWGFTLECKAVKGARAPTWLTQAAEAAVADANDWWAVVRKVPRASVGEAQVLLPRGMLGDYLSRLEPDPPYSPHDHVSLSLDAWLEVVT